MTGSLPTPRSDAAAVTIGGTAYLVGGYDASKPDASVLAGRTFTMVAMLRVPVRYPAVAALGGQIYLFGGQAITGPHAGAAVNVIQAADPARHTAAVIGSLPEPLADAAAVTVDVELFLAGGDSPAATRPAPGVGTTQLSGQSGTGGSTVPTIWAFDPATRRIFMANDDYNDRMIAINPATGALVWQYGLTGTPGTAPGQLNTPDGFDLLLPDGSTPTHPTTG